MNLQESLLAIEDKNLIDPDDTNDYPTLADLMKEQNISREEVNTVHYRRDLDSLGWFFATNIDVLILFRTKKKTLASLGDGDLYNGKKSRNIQPHLK